MSEEIEADTQAAAERFIERFGRDAPDEARRRAAELVEAGHAPAAAEWEKIAEMADALLARPENGASHLN